MSMPLWSQRDKDDTGLEEVLVGVDADDLCQVVFELHGRHDDDSNYAFLLWVKESANVEQVQERLLENADNCGAELTEVAPHLFMWREDVSG